MTTADHFLELSIPTTDIQESLDFYRRLGFAELETGDIRSYYYAVVTDGKIAVGLHGSGPEEPAVAFVHQDLARHVQDLEERGVRLAFRELGQEQFHEVGFYSPDGHLLRMMEARTFSPPGPDDIAASIVGQSSEISLRSREPETAIVFWKDRGFIVDADESDRESDHVPLIAPGISIGLRNDLRWPEPVLRFESTDIPDIIDTLENKGIAHSPVGNGVLVTAPEGTRLLIVDCGNRDGSR